MIKEVILKWEENKHKLKEYFENTSQEEYDRYEDIVKKIFDIVLVDVEGDYGSYNFNSENLTVLDHGNYQGTQIFIIPKDEYQPDVSDYIITDNYYGSCSGCDTLMSINDYTDGKPSPEQVNEYMTLAVHLVQSMRWLGERDY